MATIKRNAANTLNFLRWHEVSDFTLGTGEIPVFEDPLDFDPFAYLRAPRVDSVPEYALPVVYRDLIRFFINTEFEFTFSGFDTFLIGLIRGGELIAECPSALSRTDPDSYHIFGELTIPAAPFGVYRLAIFDADTMAVKLVSNELRVAHFDDFAKETVLIEYAHNTNIANYDFQYVFNNDSAEWSSRIRLDAALLNEQTPESKSEYEDLNEQTRLTRFSLGRTVELKTEFLDAETHRALAFVLGMDTFRIDGVNYRSEGGYERDNIDGFALSCGKVKLKDQDFRKKLKFC